MNHNIYIYILLMTVTTYAIRILPLTLIRKQITNPFIKSFLYYVPYVTLAVMTFPAITKATDKPLAGLVAFIIGSIAAYLSENLFIVSLSCCVTVFLTEIVLTLI